MTRKRGPYAPVTIQLHKAELAALQDLATRSRLSPGEYARQVILVAISNAPRRSYSANELRSIHAEARSRNHVWTEAELRERNLPLYWCDDWLRAEFAAGKTARQISVEIAAPHRTISHAARQLGIAPKPLQREPSLGPRIRKLVKSGLSRAEAAAEVGVSAATAAGYTRDLPSEQELKLQARLDAAGPWPATIVEIGERVFDGSRDRASKWGHEMINAGRLQRVAQGVYDRLPTTKPKRQ